MGQLPVRTKAGRSVEAEHWAILQDALRLDDDGFDPSGPAA